MRKPVKLSLILLIQALIVWPVLAGESPRFLEKEIVHAVFVDSTGATADFTIADGGTLSVTNEDLGLAYTLSARVVAADAVEFTLKESASDLEGFMPEEALEVPVDGGAYNSTLAPFALAVSKITVERTEAPVPRKGDSVENPDDKALVPEKATCCICCNGWCVCCRPPSGWCCTVYYCGLGCRVCS